jgi:hypothetical protein
MTKVNSSPDRHTFQVEGAKTRAEETGTKVSEQYLELWKTAREQDAANLMDPAWQNNNMEYDLRSTKWICDKVKASDSYAQNLYAAMSNMQFVKNEVWPLLRDQRWSASWRHAGGIVADMREQGDYIDWYCSGIGGMMGGGSESSPAIEEALLARKNYVPEGTITDEIREDLFRLGWIPKEWDDE